MVSGNEHDLGTGDRRQLLLGDWVLIGIAVVGQIAGDHDDVGLGVVDLGNRRAQ